MNRVQSNTGTTAWGNTCAVTLPGPTAAGNMILVWVGCYYSWSVVSSVVDANGAYLTAIPAFSSAHGNLSAYYVKNVPGGAVTVTVTTEGNTDIDVVVAEYAGCDVNNPVGAVASLAGHNPLTTPALSIASSTPVAVITAAYDPYNKDNVWAASSGTIYATTANDDGEGMCCAEQVLATASGPYDNAFTPDLADELCVAILLLEEVYQTPPPAITTAVLDPVVYNTPYTFNLATTGGMAPLTFSLDSGALPVGITLSANGTISGTTTAIGDYAIVVRVTDALAQYSTAPLTLSCSPAPTISVWLYPTYYGVPYNSGSNISGTGAPPLVFFLDPSSAALPPGLALSSGGVLSGTTTAQGDYALVFRVTDASGQYATAAWTLVCSPPPVFVGNTFPLAAINALYSYTIPNGPWTGNLTVQGGIPPLTFSVISGTLPVGLSLSSDGTVSGTATVVATKTVVIRVTDSLGRYVDGTLYIGCAPIVLSYAGAPTPEIGVPYSFTPTILGAAGPYTFSLQSITWPYPVSTLPPGLSLNTMTGEISGTPTTVGSYWGIVVSVKSGSAGPGPGGSAIYVNRGPYDNAYDPHDGGEGQIVGGPEYFYGNLGIYGVTSFSGNIPPALWLDVSTDTIRGTANSPTTKGIYDVFVNGNPARWIVELNSAIDIMYPGSPGPPDLYTGVPFTYALVGSGGISPYTFFKYNDFWLNHTATQPAYQEDLPPGITFNNPTFSGVPTVAGSGVGGWRFNVTVIDADFHNHSGTVCFNVIQSKGEAAGFNLVVGQGAGGTPPLIDTGGWRRQIVLVPNHFDLCLDDNLKLTRSIAPMRVYNKSLTIDQNPWMRVPANSVPFRKIGAIPTPLAALGDVEVVAFQIPTNYDGVISGIFNLYIGPPGFQEGSGDIEWRLAINKVFAMYLGRITVTLGSRQQSYPIDGGVEIQSGNWIRYLVNVPNLSGGILPLNSQIVCGLEGLLYARQ